ncbi:hypothetical protein IF1G_01056 [Cordyceps javanica]|uniref:Uncharacterized protein n=1 Tax=Cordyceps javanica TaxID=43265 RepID=A0A545WE98_9HYPO|nr:hypothetical protein IF1G_01056 [Cordyceps javanica]TQW12286.1 hypothetical protein IF2G_01017 [Cordyceps javanica]
MPPRSPDKTFHDLLPFSPPTPASASEKASQDQERPVPPGTLVRYFWTCHHCGCGTFRCNDVSVAVCVQCAHEICDGCTAFFGARLLRCVEAEHLPSHAPNPGCACEQPSTSSRCRRSHPIRRCPVASGTRRRMRHEPYGRPSPVQHCVVTFRPGRDGRPALGTFFFTRPRFNRSRLRAWPPCDAGTSTGTSTSTGSTRSGTRPGGQETLDCIARSVAAARAAPAIIPPIYDMLRQPLRGEPATARRGTPVCTIALARFFAAGAASVARALGVARHPVVCVRVDPMLAFVAYYLCAHFYAVFGATWKGTTTARQPSRAAPE